MGFPGSAVVKNPPTNARDTSDLGSIPDQENTLEEEMATTLVFLPGKPHEQRSLEGYGLWGHKESDTTEQLSMLTMKHSHPSELTSVNPE